MTLILKQVFAFFKLLNSDNGTTSIAAGIALGFVLGMSPLLSLQGLLVILALFFFRVQIGAATVSAFFFAFIAWTLDPVFHIVGKSVLETESLTPLFTTLYNMPLVPLTRFYNTVVMGGGVVAIAFVPVVFVLSQKAVTQYREKVVKRFKESKIFKTIKLSRFYAWYMKYDSIFG